MILNKDHLSRGYAKAIFNLACEHELQTPILELLTYLSKIFAMPLMQEFLTTYTITKSSKIDLLLTTCNQYRSYFPSIEQLLANFLNLMLSKQHWIFIKEILERYDRLYLAYYKILRVKIFSATALTLVQRQILFEILSKNLGKTVFLSYAVDPKLLGGLIITYNDQVIDFSIKTKLLMLKKHLQHNPIEEA